MFLSLAGSPAGTYSLAYLGVRSRGFISQLGGSVALAVGVYQHFGGATLFVSNCSFQGTQVRCLAMESSLIT
jgi:hypothetical protein